jgi:hypothetical protein
MFFNKILFLFNWISIYKKQINRKKNLRKSIKSYKLLLKKKKIIIT